ncbi:hypothetical protein, partial [Enterococcus faecalis]|uniref:hypothetical protein n=1 Tax=Enterococcus faecalis TaxID=1351 RepID=UPI00403F8D4A
VGDPHESRVENDPWRVGDQAGREEAHHQRRHRVVAQSVDQVPERADGIAVVGAGGSSGAS